MFVDNVELSLLSGAGGSGSISFKSKGTKSSPNGGSGGDGGSIYFKTDKKIYDFRWNFKKKKRGKLPH